MITLDAYASWMAASSAAIERTWASTGPPMATAVSPVPNPPTMMLVSDRFIASAISLVRMLPEAPTSAPATISAQFPMTNPAIATAVPVNAFSSEITTGMSAPPIGSTIITPNPSDASTRMSMAGRLAVVNRNTPVPTAMTARAMLSSRPPLKISGWPGMKPCSLPAAMIDPENVTDPMSTSSTVNTVVLPSTPLAWDSAS